MRLDRFLSDTGTSSRTESKRAARAGQITVNGTVCRDASAQIDEYNDTVIYCGKKVIYSLYTYIMLNKPAGYISATDDPRKKTVLDLLPDNLKKLNLFPCGRLDIDTTGLLILTNNGQLAHRLLTPKFHVGKTYSFTCSPALTEDNVRALCAGVDIGEKSPTKPAELTLLPHGTSGTITISEGKFHQIKRMFIAVGSEITSLSRLTFAGIPLDSSLREGDFRPLDEKETAMLENAGNL